MYKFTILWLFVFGYTACTYYPETAPQADTHPVMIPDYRECTVPPNIAPLNFKLPNADLSRIRFMSDNNTLLDIKGGAKTDIPLKFWQRMLRDMKGQEIRIKILARSAGSGNWEEYPVFNIHIAQEEIDPYIAYRLIEPGYELWGQMGIFQRNLSNFEETAVIENRLLDKGCINCHSFADYSPDRFMFHVRKENGGTVIADRGKIEKINLKTPATIGAGTYPMWHPSGNYIAFSVNVTRQAFHAYQEKKIEVYDLESDLIIYDVHQKTVLADPRFNNSPAWETFPAWSPDGEWLYFCQANPQQMPFEYKKLKYGIYRVPFSPGNGKLGDSLQLLTDTTVESGCSAVMPRISPDGRYLLYTAAECGTFPIWHKEADLHMLDLQNNREIDISELNSEEVESYHSWSSNSRWILFSSRRTDGRYTRLYLAYLDPEGKVHKPFPLPQQDPDFYTHFLKSYNIPEFIKGKIELNEAGFAEQIEALQPASVTTKTE